MHRLKFIDPENPAGLRGGSRKIVWTGAHSFKDVGRVKNPNSINAWFRNMIKSIYLKNELLLFVHETIFLEIYRVLLKMHAS